MYDREPLYVISVAARLLGMHAQTLRKYERERFITPSRTQGRLRLYSAEDIARLRQIKTLVEERSLNLAGVNLALTLSERLAELRETIREASSLAQVAERCDQEIGEILLLLGAVEVAEAADRDPTDRSSPERPRTAERLATGTTGVRGKGGQRG